MLLYGAALAPHAAAWPARWRWLGAYLLADPVYALAAARFSKPDGAAPRGIGCLLPGRRCHPVDGVAGHDRGRRAAGRGVLAACVLEPGGGGGGGGGGGVGVGGGVRVGWRSRVVVGPADLRLIGIGTYVMRAAFLVTARANRRWLRGSTSDPVLAAITLRSSPHAARSRSPTPCTPDMLPSCARAWPDREAVRRDAAEGTGGHPRRRAGRGCGRHGERRDAGEPGDRRPT